MITHPPFKVKLSLLDLLFPKTRFVFEFVYRCCVWCLGSSTSPRSPSTHTRIHVYILLDLNMRGILELYYVGVWLWVSIFYAVMHTADRKSLVCPIDLKSF